MRAVVFPCDNLIGRVVAANLKAQGYEVTGAAFGSMEPSSTVNFVVDANSTDDVLTAMSTADVVVYQLLKGREPEAYATIVKLSKANRPSTSGTLSSPTTFVAISHPLTWAATPISPPPRRAAADGQHHPGSAAPSVKDGGVSADPSFARLRGEKSTMSVASYATLRSTNLSTRGGDKKRTGPASVVSGSAAPNDDVDSVDEYVQSGPLVITAAELPRRRSPPAFQKLADLELLALHAQRPGKLHTYVVVPGLVYGLGEDDAHLAPYFKQAWLAAAPLPVYGGPLAATNSLPTIHVSDLAAYVSAVAAAGPESQYLLAVDDVHMTQAAFVEALSGALGSGETVAVPQERFLALDGVPLTLLADLPMVATPLPPGSGYSPAHAAGGLLAHMAKVREEYLTARNLHPLGIVLTGPPMAGKSTLAARLGHLYDLDVIGARDLLAQIGNVGDEAVQKAMQAELSGKEKRLSAKHMGLLLNMALNDRAVRNRGYVLDGLPKGLQMAQAAFMRLVRRSPEELATLDGADGPDKSHPNSASKARKGSAGKEPPAPAPAAAPKARAGSAGKKKGDDGSVWTDVRADMKVVLDAAIVPKLLIELKAADAQLLERLKAVEAAEVAEVEAAAAAADGGKPAAGGGKPALSAPKARPAGSGKKEKGAATVATGTHNNEKDFGRRLNGYKALRKEDAEDLNRTIAALQAAYQEKQAAALEAVKAAQKAAAEAAAKEKKKGGAAGGGAAALQAEASLLAEAPVIEPPKLPQYAGFVGFFHDAGTKYVMLDNPNMPTGVPERPLETAAVPALEEAVAALAGPPHNFQGFPPEGSFGALGRAQRRAAEAADSLPVPPPPGSGDAAALLSAASAAELASEATAAEVAAAEQEALDHMKQLDLDADVDMKAAQKLLWGHQSVPLLTHLMATVMPAITRALCKLSKDRPADPAASLAAELRAFADQLDTEFVDPYTAEVYGIQAGKIRAKEERDAARAAALKAKQERLGIGSAGSRVVSSPGAGRPGSARPGSAQALSGVPPPAADAADAGTA